MMQQDHLDLLLFIEILEFGSCWRGTTGGGSYVRCRAPNERQRTPVVWMRLVESVELREVVFGELDRRSCNMFVRSSMGYAQSRDVIPNRPGKNHESFAPTVMFSTILSGFAVRGMTATPRASVQRNTTATALTLSRSAIAATTGERSIATCSRFNHRYNTRRAGPSKLGP